MTEISLIFWLFVSATLGSLLACWIILWYSAKILPKRIQHGVDITLNSVLEDNPEVIDRVTAQAMASAIGHMQATYEEDPEGFVDMLGPMVGVVIKKIKDHIFSAKGVINRKAHAEADELEGSMIEELTGGMISAKLLDEHPLLGSIMQMAMSRPEIMQKLTGGSGGGSTQGSSSSGSGGLIQQ